MASKEGKEAKMLNKYGVNSTKAEKRGPLVKDGIKRKVEKTIVCACGKKFVKDCPNETLCELSSFFCPYCGAEIK